MADEDPHLSRLLLPAANLTAAEAEVVCRAEVLVVEKIEVHGSAFRGEERFVTKTDEDYSPSERNISIIA